MMVLLPDSNRMYYDVNTMLLIQTSHCDLCIMSHNLPRPK